MNPNARIFVVEDDPAYMAVLEHHLRSDGFTNIKKFSRGEDVLEALEEKPDVILLDFSLEGLNGLDTLIQLRKMKSKARVAILTALESDEIKHECLSHGANRYIQKSDDGQAELKEFLRESGNTSSNLVIWVVLALIIVAAVLYYLFF